MNVNREPIGGYFELELPRKVEFHRNAIALNTGRNCLEYILRARDYRHIYIPYYSCDVLLEPFRKLGVDFSFYHINSDLELEDNIVLKEDEAIIYINYYGLKQKFIDGMAERYGKQLIVDNTQSFFSMPISGIDTFYSCRKFFGVADGAYLYCDKRLDMEMEQDQSWNRMCFLLKRIDKSPEAAYRDFCANDEQLKENPIRTMSPLTHCIMKSIDYANVAETRRRNYMLFDAAFANLNGISLRMDEDAVPMVYPLYLIDFQLRQFLIDHRIYVAKYWPNVKDCCSHESVEYGLTDYLIPLPIDQRYGNDEIKEVIKLIKQIL